MVPVDTDATVLANDRLSPAYNVVRLAAPAVGAACRPGQFVMVKPDSGPDPLLRRPFSVFEVLRDDRGEVHGISLLNKAVGPVTGRLFAIEPGQRIQCLGPLGRAFSVCVPPVRAWLVAGGVGVAPFLTLAEALGAAGTRTTLFYGGRSAGDLYYLEAFEALGVQLVLTTEDGSRGETGRVTAPLARALAARTADESVRVYACGPTAMMQAAVRLATRHGCPSEVSLEPVMGCGLGGCYSCVVPVRDPDGVPHFVRSCLEGPVFAGDRIDWSGLGPSPPADAC